MKFRTKPDGTREVVYFVNSNVYTKTVTEEEERMLLRAIESGKEEAKRELRCWLKVDILGY